MVLIFKNVLSNETVDFSPVISYYYKINFIPYLKKKKAGMRNFPTFQRPLLHCYFVEFHVFDFLELLVLGFEK